MFRPCIDLHQGKVKQIVGGTLGEDPQGPTTNFVAEQSSAWFAELYKRDSLRGGHVIMLGLGNEAAAKEALAVYPQGLQVGGGISAANAREFLDAGASHVIVTSWVFREGRLDRDRLQTLVDSVGKQRLVLDLSCRKKDDEYFVMTDRWQRFTQMTISPATLEELSGHCDEFLVHAVDVEGLCKGVDLALIERLARWAPIATTYAGGASSMEDMENVHRVGRGRIELTVGSALDIFGGNGIRYQDAVAFHREVT